MTTPALTYPFRAGSITVLLAFGIIYFVWGSTFVAIRFAIDTIPPLLMGGMRFLIAGSLLYLWCSFRFKERPTRLDWKHGAIVGALLLLLGNGSLIWSEQYISSGYAALICATIPMWMVLFSWLANRSQRPQRSTLFGVLAGFSGVAILTTSDLQISGPDVQPLSLRLTGTILLLFGTMSWAAGSLYSSKTKSGKTPLLYLISINMLVGGALLSILGLGLGEWRVFSLAAFSSSSLLALGYLISFGTLLAYIAYVWLLQTSTPEKVGTYAFVNPLVAILLGWLLAGEAVNAGILTGAAIILLSVIMILRSQHQSSATAAAEIPAEKAISSTNPLLYATKGLIARTWHGMFSPKKAV